MVAAQHEKGLGIVHFDGVHVKHDLFVTLCVKTFLPNRRQTEGHTNATHKHRLAKHTHSSADLSGEAPSIDIVSQEEVLCARGVATNVEQTKQIVKLTVQITAH